jgi:Uncharacterized conserved protein
MTAIKRNAVFLGPSLAQKEARCILDADYYPPARKGDLYWIKASGVKTIILIDGVFHSTPSVWQREIIHVIKQGIQVVGASSIGALRAAELQAHGMIGHGRVFEWYRAGLIDGDDEVALLHGSIENDFHPLSEPLVNIRFTLGKAVEDRCLDAGLAHQLITYAKQLYYPDRSYQRLLQSAIVKALSPMKRVKVQRYCQTKSIDIKRLDAIAVLKYCSTLRAGRKQATGCPPYLTDEVWWEGEELLLTGFAGPSVKVGAQILAKARENAALTKAMRTTLSRRHFLLEWARQNKVRCPESFRCCFVRKWKEEDPARGGMRWLRANGLTRAGLWPLLEERALADWISKKGPAYFGLDRSFISEWAKQNGVSPSRICSVGRSTASPLDEHIIERDPAGFGLHWNFDKAFLEELQVSGKAAALAAT